MCGYRTYSFALMYRLVWNKSDLTPFTLDEIHQFRAQLLAQHQDDFAAYFAALLARQQQHPERYASFVQPTSGQLGSSQVQKTPLAPQSSEPYPSHQA